MAVLIEFLVGSALAIFFHSVLHYEAQAYTIFGVGVLISLGTYLLREDLFSMKACLCGIYRESHELTNAVSQIDDAECQVKAKEIMGKTVRTIGLLQKGIIPLEESEFYLEAAKALDVTSATVKAVDPLTAAWSSRGVLFNFYEANVRAVERGVKIIRIFVVNREEFPHRHVQLTLMTQLRDGIDVRVTYRDELPSEGESMWSEMCSFNFGIYDDHLVTDVYAKPGTYYGRKSGRPEEVCKYLKLFDLIVHNAYKIAIENGEIVVLAGGGEQGAV
jgi:hypothetical protein